LLERFFVQTIFKAERFGKSNPEVLPSLLERFFACMFLIEVLTVLKLRLYVGFPISFVSLVFQ